MSPTSYQTAPPRTSIINNALNRVKPRRDRTFPIFRHRPIPPANQRIHGLVHSIEEKLRFVT